MLSEQHSNEISNNPEPESDPNQPMVYQIRVKSYLDSDWTDWFEGLTITLEKTGHTLLTGPVVDQAALHGLLKKIRDLGMLLISVNTLEPAASTTLGTRQADAVDDQP
jgi:hypothetical protein